jgi:glycosyltransferase involved in cell wall biosynthesis
MKPTPILFLSDSPSAPSGLGRICRDLASRLATVPEFKVGVLGKGGVGTSKLTFPQYFIPAHGADFGQQVLEEVWWDFAGVEHGILFSINDPSRMLWLARPEYSGDDQLESFLRRDHFKRWGYFPIDATGISDRLTGMSGDTLRGYDRVLAYTDWAAGVIERTTGKRPPSLPHGIDTTVFSPQDKARSRKFLNPKLGGEDFVVGIVATNQQRKDWGLGMTVVAKLREKIPNVRVWVHTDTLLRDGAWDINALVADLGLDGNVVVTGKMTDKELAKCYSACDVTLAPGLGEGFGYPIVESLACGVPVVHGNYGGGAELLDPDFLVEPVSYRLETPLNRVCPVFDPQHWTDKVLDIRGEGNQSDECRAAIAHLDWTVLWPKWHEWFLEGIR